MDTPWLLPTELFLGLWAPRDTQRGGSGFRNGGPQATVLVSAPFDLTLNWRWL